MISYSTIVTDLKTIADSSADIGGYGYGPQQELNAFMNTIESGSIYVWYQPQVSSGVPYGNQMIGSRTLSFSMYVMTQPTYGDVEAISETSDCELMGYRIMKTLFDGADYNDITLRSTTAAPMFEYLEGSMAGWVFDFTLETPANGIECL